MNRSQLGRRFRVVPFVAALLLPTLAWAGGTAVVPPLVGKGVDPKVSTNITSLLSTELDFSGAYDTVNEMAAAPASLNTTCLTSTSCLAGIAKSEGADAVLAGSVGSGSEGLQLYLVLYDAKKNAIIKKKTFDVASDVSSVAAAAPKFIKEMVTAGGAVAEEKAPTPTFDTSEDDDFAMDSNKSSNTKMNVKAHPQSLEDEEDPAEAEAAAAAAKAKAQAEAKAKAQAEAQAKAEAAAKARAQAEAQARAEAEAKAKAEAAARAKAEADARAAAEAKARAQAKADADAKAKAKPKTQEDEDLEAELANFSFGGSSNQIAVESGDEDAPEEEETPRSFSEKYGSSSTSAKSKPAASKTTTSSKRISEPDEDEPEEDRIAADDEPDEEPEDLDEPAPKRKAVARVEEEDEDLDEPAPKKKVVKEDLDEEDEDAPPKRTAKREDLDEPDEDVKPKRVQHKEEDMDLDRPSRSSATYDPENEKSPVSITARAGYASYGALGFITGGGELAIPVTPAIHIVAGIGGAWTKRNYTDQVRRKLAEEQNLSSPDDVEDWNTILPINAGVQYKATVANGHVRPYGGADITFTPYTSDFQVAFGARARGGSDFMIIRNFGFNVDLGLGFMAGDQFETVQKDMPNIGFLPTISAGTVIAF